MSQLTNNRPHIICFGDSLTVGFQSPTRFNPEYEETPYGSYLQNYLGNSKRVVINGINGELTSEMVNRFTRDVLNYFPQYVIILGGTNDLGWDYPPSKIFSNLSCLYDQSQAAGIIPVAISIPSLRPVSVPRGMDFSKEEFFDTPEGQGIRSHIERRVVLNSQIQQYCGSKGIPYIDLFFETAEPDSKVLADRYSNDGLHLSTLGYQRLAELLWDQVLENAEWKHANE